MATAFDRWEKDPFFYAAEEVQESTDRMESVYRRWMREKGVAMASGGGEGDAFVVELRREVHTALGTAKWQLEELEKVVRYSDHALAAGEDTVTRHCDFVAAIRSKVSMVEKALMESNLGEEKSDLAWVQLDEGERDELALFLSGSRGEGQKVLATPSGGVHEAGNKMSGDDSVCSKKSCHANEFPSPELTEDNMQGHRRVASSCADSGVWKISVSCEEFPRKSDEQPNLPPPRILSLSELRTVESASKPKWYRNGFRKWKVANHDDMEESIPLQNHPLSRGMNACYEKSKSYLSDFADDSSNKQLYGWLGAFQRQIQRSQYQIQYGRPIQMIIWTAATITLLGAGFCCMLHTSRTAG